MTQAHQIAPRYRDRRGLIHGVYCAVRGPRNKIMDLVVPEYGPGGIYADDAVITCLECAVHEPVTVCVCHQCEPPSDCTCPQCWWLGPRTSCPPECGCPPPYRYQDRDGLIHMLGCETIALDDPELEVLDTTPLTCSRCIDAHAFHRYESRTVSP